MIFASDIGLHSLDLFEYFGFVVVVVGVELVVVGLYVFFQLLKHPIADQRPLLYSPLLNFGLIDISDNLVQLLHLFICLALMLRLKLEVMVTGRTLELTLCADYLVFCMRITDYNGLLIIFAFGFRHWFR